HSFAGGLRGPGGFPNISAVTDRICFVGTLTTGGLEVGISGSGVEIRREGQVAKFVPRVREVTFSAEMAKKRGQQVRFITERAVFSLEADGVILIEVAPGIDPERDVIAHMGFRPAI